MLARPFLKLAGHRIDPALNARQRTMRNRGDRGPGLQPTGRARRTVELPKDAVDQLGPLVAGRRRVRVHERRRRTASSSGSATPRRARRAPSRGSASTTSSARRSRWMADGTRRCSSRAVPAGRAARAAASARARGPGRRGDRGEDLEGDDVPGPAQEPRGRSAVRVLRDEPARARRRRRAAKATPIGKPAIYARGRPVAGRRAPARDAAQAAVQLPRAERPLRADDRGLEREQRRGRARRSPTCPIADEIPPQGVADRAAGDPVAGRTIRLDARVGRGARRRRPAEEGAAPRPADDARGAVRRASRARS